MIHDSDIHHQPSIASVADFNFGWHFFLGDSESFSTANYDDSQWRSLRLPHDWSIEFAPDQEKGDGATAYLPGGIGWYRKHFTAPTDDDQLVFVLFDGIYNHSQIWCNGQKLGENPYGYSPFWFDLTPLLQADSEEQVLAVRVDHSRYVDSRWYTGSGIYRDVKLITKSRLHIPIWGTRLTTPEITDSRARVELAVSVKNAFDNDRAATVRTVILDADSIEVAAIETPITVHANEEQVCVQSLTIVDPQRWGPDHPYCYRAMTTLTSDKQILETYETPIGIRTVRFDADEGFFLNGQNTLIKGVCLHHDGGLVGAAVPDGVWRRRLTVLKEMGCNAIRTAHNPPSAAFLDLCDEMGFLVQLEFFDEWDVPKDKRLNLHERHDDEISRGYAEDFTEWAESDLKRTMLRDRNHPSIFQWSIGNEIEWAYTRYAAASGYFDDEGQENWFWTEPPISAKAIKERFDASPEGEHTLMAAAEKLSRWTKEMDETRPLFSNCVLPSVSHETGFTALLDVVGYSYRQVVYDRNHKLYPSEVIMGGENLGQWHEWKHVVERPFVSGLFYWTGIYYLGEAHNRWPVKASRSGMVDLAGFEAHSYHMMRSLWRDDPHVHLTTQTLETSPYHIDADGNVVEVEPGSWARRLWGWHNVNGHWNYQVGEVIAVEVYTNCDEVELFINGRSLGSKRLLEQDDHILKWALPFEAGFIEARGRNGDGGMTTESLTTAESATAIQLTIDKATLANDGYDVAHLIAQVVDANGNPVRQIERELIFSVEGPFRVLGVDNGAADNIAPYQTDRVETSQGRALMIVQSQQSEGTVEIAVHASGLPTALTSISVVG